MKAFTAFALLPLALATPLPATSSDSPPAFKILKVTSGGSGCPQGTIDIKYTDTQVLPIYFNGDFTAAVGPGVAIDQSRKNCQIAIGLSYSPGWSYSVYSADYHGYVNLDAGVKGMVKSIYYFAGYTDQATSTMSLNGPVSGWYNKHDEIEVGIWSPCGGDSILNVNSEVAITSTQYGGNGVIAALKDNQRFINSVHIAWKKC